MTIEINQKYYTKEVDDPFSKRYYVNIKDVKMDQKNVLWVQYAFANLNDDGTWGRDGMTSTMREKHFLEIYELYSSEGKVVARPGTAIKQLEVEDEC